MQPLHQSTCLVELAALKQSLPGSDLGKRHKIPSVHSLTNIISAMQQALYQLCDQVRVHYGK